MEARISAADTAIAMIHSYYHQGRKMACPDCGGSQWIVGRVVAECARCETVLPLAASHHRRCFDGMP